MSSLSVKEAREILGEVMGTKLTDDEVQNLIWDLEAIARLTIRDLMVKRQEILYNHPQGDKNFLDEISKSSGK